MPDFPPSENWVVIGANLATPLLHCHIHLISGFVISRS